MVGRAESLGLPKPQALHVALQLGILRFQRYRTIQLRTEYWVWNKGKKIWPVTLIAVARPFWRGMGAFSAPVRHVHLRSKPECPVQDFETRMKLGGFLLRCFLDDLLDRLLSGGFLCNRLLTSCGLLRCLLNCLSHSFYLPLGKFESARTLQT
jgi:hypothetical protein